MTSEAHVHHWMLADPEGGEIPGVCAGCGEQRTYYMTPPSTQPKKIPWGRSARRKKADT